MKKKKNVIARVGNFEVVKDSGREHDYVRIRAVNGHWSISHRDDSMMYGVWMEMCKDPEWAEGMQVLVTMAYCQTTVLLDEEFIRDFFKAFDAMSKRAVANMPEPTTEEECMAMQEVELMTRDTQTVDNQSASTGPSDL